MKGLCIGSPGIHGLIYTANWSDTLPEADRSIVEMSAALKNIKVSEARANK
jgi:hypothetical protein